MVFHKALFVDVDVDDLDQWVLLLMMKLSVVLVPCRSGYSN
jgi:hypothetical protein